MIIHKENHKNKCSVPVGLGQYALVPKPICNNNAGYYVKVFKTYYMHRNWNMVTCKRCLKRKILK